MQHYVDGLLEISGIDFQYVVPVRFEILTLHLLVPQFLSSNCAHALGVCGTSIMRMWTLGLGLLSDLNRLLLLWLLIQPSSLEYI